MPGSLYSSSIQKEEGSNDLNVQVRSLQESITSFEEQSEEPLKPTDLRGINKHCAFSTLINFFLLSAKRAPVT